MKANTKYTALEILKEAGYKNAEDKFGKFRVVIGGIMGIVKPDHVVGISEGTKNLEITVGIETKIIKVLSSKNAEVSDGARETLDNDGRIELKRQEKIKK